MRRVFVFLLSVISVSCGRTTPQASKLDYAIADTSFAGLSRHVKEAEINVCYDDATQSDTHKAAVQFAVLSWVDALRDIAKGPLATKASIVDPNAPDCQVTVFIGNFQPAYTEMGDHPAIHLNYDGWYGSKTVTLHEFGHAFGLLDTYAGRGGSCQPGQPNSVMCEASYNKLQPDDVAGIRDMFSELQTSPNVAATGKTRIAY